MNLYVDIGNSRIKWATDKAGLIQGLTALAYTTNELPALLVDNWGSMDRPDRVLVANVAGKNVADILVKACADIWSSAPCFIRVQEESCGVINGYDDISQLGVDRWLSIIAAWSGCHGDVCVVGCGTAVTVDLISADGRHLGGYIVPGTFLMQRVLTQGTQGIEIDPHPSAGIAPGRSTRACAGNGTTLAVVALIDRAVSDFRKRVSKNVECIITGGGAANILPLLGADFKYEPDLVLRGISIMSKGITA